MSSMRKTAVVSEVMTRKVRTGTSGQSLGEIWRIMVDERCHHMPILEEGRLVGMISTSDLVALARKHGSKRLDSGFLDSMTAADAMTTKLESIQADESIDAAIDRIGPGEFHALVVLDEADGLAGIVTHHDLLYYLAS